MWKDYKIAGMSSTINPFEPPKASLETSADAEAAPALWNPDAAGLWSLLLTPIFGSILVRKNWRAIGDEAKARTGMVWIVASVLMLIPSIAFSLGPFIYIIVWYLAWQRPQAQYIKQRWGKDYPRKGWGMPLLWAVLIYVGAVVVLAVVFVAIGVTTTTK